MTQIGEAVNVTLATPPKPKYVVGAILEIRFESKIDVYDLLADETEKQLPPPGEPHWARGKPKFPAVYVREGGKDGIDTLKVKVKWAQKDCDGKATLEGTSPDVTISGEFSISGDSGETVVDCKFTKRPGVVTNYGRGVSLDWQIKAGGETGPVSGGTPLSLYFVEQKPKPIGWLGEYKSFYLPIIEWATRWAQGTRGEAQVRDAIWDKFSDGTGARVPHATTFEYWKTSNPVQNLKKLLRPGSTAGKDGWSCRAIAHVFMESLALHGIECREVIPECPGHLAMFLVQNWRADPKPRNWPTQHPHWYYGGSWVRSPRPPLNTPVRGSLANETGGPLVIDLLKQPGVPAQGQKNPPLGFSNHWIVEVSGKLYDTSYGAVHPNDLGQYASRALAGWLLGTHDDEEPGTQRPCEAWICEAIARHSLLPRGRGGERHN